MTRSNPAGSLEQATNAPPAAAAAIRQIYQLLDATYRNDVWHWMPEVAPDPMHIIAGAVLVQHTTWINAERALYALRDAGLLNPAALIRTPEPRIAEIVRISGTPAVKARRLRAVCETIVRGGGSEAFLAQPASALREQLLATHGVGPETADAIALYAGAHPAFVIDAYTRRVFGRLGPRPDGDTYDAWQRWFEAAFPRRDPGAVEVYRRYHGYIVLHAKATCRAVPACAACPLHGHCAAGATA